MSARDSSLFIVTRGKQRRRLCRFSKLPERSGVRISMERRISHRTVRARLVLCALFFAGCADSQSEKTFYGDQVAPSARRSQIEEQEAPEQAHEDKLGSAFAVHLDAAPSPFSTKHHLLRVGVQGKRVAKSERKNAHLVFLVDVSGSMNFPDKLSLANQGA